MYILSIILIIHINHLIGERSQMTSSKIRVFTIQTTSPFRHFCHTPGPLDDVIFHWQNCFLLQKFKNYENQDLAMNIIQYKNQSTCCWLNGFRYKITHFNKWISILAFTAHELTQHNGHVISTMQCTALVRYLGSVRFWSGAQT